LESISTQMLYNIIVIFAQHKNRVLRAPGLPVFGAHTMPHFSSSLLINKHSKSPVVNSHSLLYVVVLPCYHVVMNPRMNPGSLQPELRGSGVQAPIMSSPSVQWRR